MFSVLCLLADECCVSKYGFQEMPLVVGSRASQSWTLGCVGGWMASLEARIRRRVGGGKLVRGEAAGLAG